MSLTLPPAQVIIHTTAIQAAIALALKATRDTLQIMDSALFTSTLANVMLAQTAEDRERALVAVAEGMLVVEISGTRILINYVQIEH